MAAPASAGGSGERCLNTAMYRHGHVSLQL